MKRKLFFVLFALAALASFQVSAQDLGPVWIKADITGLDPQLPFSGNKVVQKNWFVYNSTMDSTLINTSKNILDDGLIDQFTISQVNDNMLSFRWTNAQPGTAEVHSGDFNLTYNGKKWTQFEVVQFNDGATPPVPADGVTYGWKRATQAVEVGMQGYLMPAQGGIVNGVIQTDITPSMLLVVADKLNKLQIKRWDDVFVPVMAAGNPIFDSYNYVFTSYANYNCVSHPNAPLWAANLNTAMATNGFVPAQAPLTFNVATGNYSRMVAYVNQTYYNDVANGIILITDPITNPLYTTQYIGTATDSNGALTDPNPANWTHGKPCNVLTVDATITSTDPYDVTPGPSSAELYKIVIQLQNTTTDLKPEETDPALSGLTYTDAAIANQWRPVYINVEKPEGRWAQTKDFEGCQYWDFPGLDVAKVSTTGPTYLGTQTFNTFAVTMVDWVAKNANGQSGANMIGNTGEAFPGGKPENNYFNAKFQGLDDGGAMIGLQTDNFPNGVNNHEPEGIIPLFVLSSPEAGCDVVSVSRMNDQDIQSLQDAVYANKLELRTYGDYYDFFHWNSKGDSVYTPHHATAGLPWDGHNGTAYAGSPVLDEERVATSLQKFAIWIDIYGKRTLYPAAAYAWNNGNDHSKQPSKVAPNSVLLYNDINITGSISFAADADKLWGTQIGTWNGKTTQNNSTLNPTIATSPNNLQSRTDYTPLQFVPTCNTPDAGNIKDRWYFLEVQDDVVGTPAAGSLLAKATQLGAYQDKSMTKYVLSVEVKDGTKHLIITPKERVRRYNDGADGQNGNGNKWYDDLAKYKHIEDGTPATVLPDYWTNNPYDSVNMAAHWSMRKVDGGYKLVNMLGDVLEYNDVMTAIAGGNLPVNNDISKDGIFHKDDNNPASPPWFPVNSNTASSAVRSVWTVAGIPGRDGFMLVNDLGGLQVNGDLTQRGTHARSDRDSLYFQQNVDLTAPAQLAMPYRVAAKNLHCKDGLILKQTEIYYVPTFSGSYGTEKNNLVINTNDKEFWDPIAKVDRDSLTAYLLLDGKYGVTEATDVNNDLLLGSLVQESGANAAALVAKAQGDPNLQFIPLVSVAQTRNMQIRTAAKNGTINPVSLDKDTLSGETYKWFIVQNTAGQYLKFDTIAKGALDNRSKVALTFKKVDLANATPVRLYQPLVGDKLQGNFLIQFQIPYNTYYYDATTAANNHAIENTWPDIESKNVNAILPSNVLNNGGRVFGQLLNQSTIIGANIDRAQATRFTYTGVSPDKCPPCPGEFIDPKWMGQERLLNLPLSNHIWEQGAAINAWIASATAAYGTNGNYAIVTNDETDPVPAMLTHTYVQTIHVFNYPTSNPMSRYNEDGIAKVFIPGTTALGDTTWIGGTKNGKGNTCLTDLPTGFRTDLPVDLYTISNKEEKYLTVIRENDLRDAQGTTQATPDDVNGVKLAWMPKILYNRTDIATYGYDRRVLQMFAISGCKQNVNGEYGTFIYLPLASFETHYANGSTAYNANTFYNSNLGKSNGNLVCPGNDVFSCYRISQHMSTAGTLKNLVVFRSSGTAGSGNWTPIEFKLSKKDYLMPDCEYQLVKETSTKSAHKNQFYTIDNWLAKADANTMVAHWKIENPNPDNDPMLATFAPELGKTLYAYDNVPIEQKQLTGQYYFVDTVANGFGNQYRMIDVSGYDAGDFTAKFDTVTITCTDHSLPFYDLDKDGFNIDAFKMAILETPYLDRSLSDVVKGNNSTPAPVYRTINNKKVQVGWRTFISQPDACLTGVKYLTIYRENRRFLTEVTTENNSHMIPYYSFSFTDSNDKEFFLNVETTNGVGKDSVYWASVSADSIKKLRDYENPEYANFMPKFKFCLPYAYKDNNGTREDSATVCGSDRKYPPVYLQTLDTDVTDYPYLIIAGAATIYVTTTNIADALLTDRKDANLLYNIYTLNYTDINLEQVTSWVFAGSAPSGNIWVPIQDIVHQAPGSDEANKVGQFTDMNMKGSAFITASGNTPNWGTLTGAANAPQLTVTFEGDTTIGNFVIRPIWYYRISLGDNVLKQYLTDATGDATIAKFPFNGNDYNIGYFTAAKTQKSIDKPIFYDQNFVQTFGFRYVTSDTSVNQAFYIVSNANFGNPKDEASYRFLAQVNNHLVFVSGVQNALVFQWGKVADDGSYTNINVVGQGNIFGVNGGVRVLNSTGKVDIYTIDGRLIRSAVLTESDQTIATPRGMVVVKNGSNVVKVVVQ